MALAIGQDKYILWKKHRVRVVRTAAETYKVGFTWSRTPYNVKVGALIPGSAQGSDENTFVAPAPVHPA
jgi:hypothetical protein